MLADSAAEDDRVGTSKRREIRSDIANLVYVGEIRHREKRHAGQHEPIMDRELWERVQRQLRDQAARCRARATKTAPRPLAGRLFDENGQCLYVAGAAKGERRYRYCVSRQLVTGSADKVRNGWRLSAPEIERTVAAGAQQLLDDHAQISASACDLGVGAGDIPAVLEAASTWSRRLQSEADRAAALKELVDKAKLKPPRGRRGGVYEICERLTGDAAGELLAHWRAAPEVPAAAHVESSKVMAATRRALAHAGYSETKLDAE